jgi:hypothetical protein
MGFNLGIAMGAGATSALNTYTTLSKMQQEQEKFAREKKQWKDEDEAAALMKSAYAGPQESSGTSVGQALQGLDRPDAAGNTMGQEGRAALEEALSKLSPEQAQAALQQYTRAYGADPKADPGVYKGQNGLFVTDKPYNPEQAYVDAALKSGNQVALKQARANQLTGLQIDSSRQGLEEGKYRLGSLQRQADTDTQIAEERKKWQQQMASMHTEIQDTFARDGVNGVLKYAEPQLKKAGLTGSVMGNTVTLKRGKDVVEQFDVKDAPAAIDKYMGQQYVHGFAQHLVDMGLTTTAEAMNWALGRERNDISNREVAIKESLAPSEIAKNNAAAGASTAMANATRSNIANREEAAKLIQQWDALTPAQRDGPEGLALQQKFNMLSVKAGGTVPLTTKGAGGSKGSVLKQPVDIKKNDDGTYTAFPKDGGQALYNTFNGEAIPLGMEVSAYQDMKKQARNNGVKLVAGEENGRLVLRYQGVDGQYYEDPEQAKYAKAPKAGGAPDSTEAPKSSAIPAPEGSPIARARANREANAAKIRDADAERRTHVQQAIETSRQTNATTPQSRFEVDRKTMSKAELLRRYGNGAGLTDEQYMYMTQ